MNAFDLPRLSMLLSLLLVTGCDDGVQGEPFRLAEHDDVDHEIEDICDDTDTGDDPAPPEGPEHDLAGSWGMLLNVSVLQGGLPVLGASPVSSRNWYLVEAAPDGDGGLVTSERLCAVQLVPDTWVNRPVVPQAFVDHVAPLRREVRLTQGEQGLAWVTDRVCEVRGARLCDAEHDPLPEPGADANPAAPCDAPCDGAPCDQDGDGHPGMTTWLTGFYNCEVYAVHRWCSRLEGIVGDDDTIFGLITGLLSEQVVLGASSSFCRVESTLAVPDPCAARQYFEMVRLPPGATCADVMELTGCDEDPVDCAANPDLPLDPRGGAFGDPCP